MEALERSSRDICARMSTYVYSNVQGVKKD